MPVSSNTLFHFTSKYETLLKILNSQGFWPRYCIEYGWGKGRNYNFAVAQCCFCDIPLSLIQNHTKTYGEYGLGMSKDWGIRCKLSPLHYYVENSAVLDAINNLRKNANEQKLRSSIDYLSFIKQYKGFTYRQDEQGNPRRKNNIVFYDEREWRFVPIINGACACKVIKDSNDFDVNKESENTKDYMCMFTAKDIKYIIIKDEEERMMLLKELDSMNFDKDELPLLKSKILTSMQIKEDF